MDRLKVARRGPGRARTRPGQVLGDKAYSSTAIRAHLRRRGIKATIPEPADQAATGPGAAAGAVSRPPSTRLPTSSATPSSAPSASSPAPRRRYQVRQTRLRLAWNSRHRLNPDLASSPYYMIYGTRSGHGLPGYRRRAGHLPQLDLRAERHAAAVRLWRIHRRHQRQPVGYPVQPADAHRHHRRGDRRLPGRWRHRGPLLQLLPSSACTPKPSPTKRIDPGRRSHRAKEIPSRVAKGTEVPLAARRISPRHHGLRAARS